jgi:hypothetical protein
VRAYLQNNQSKKGWRCGLGHRSCVIWHKALSSNTSNTKEEGRKKEGRKEGKKEGWKEGKKEGRTGHPDTENSHVCRDTMKTPARIIIQPYELSWYLADFNQDYSFLSVCPHMFTGLPSP